MQGMSSRHDKPGAISRYGRSEPRNLSLECLRKITNNFSDDRLLGEGGFGKVYKGVLQNGELIAVKKFASSTPGVNDRHFENEAHHLMRLHHNNIVSLVGCCSETEKIYVKHNGVYVWAEKRERLLCLEYMPKGNLREYLSAESFGLDWDARYKIIEGICYGLHYLHEEWQPDSPIIHMDLKPANILLDNNMLPKIADFGLSRLFSEEQTRTCTTSRDGTLGYMAPEYINRGIITKMSDIFSLGVIIIETVTGHRDYPDETGTSSQEFIEAVLKNWRNRLEKASGTPQEIDCQQIRKCIQIGLACVKPDRLKRPTINHVIKMLHELEGSEYSYIKVVKPASKQHNRKRKRSSEPTNDCTSTENTVGASANFGDVGPLDDNVESFSSDGDGDARNIYTAPGKSPAEAKPATSKGFTFNLVDCWRTNNSKIICCHFSSDGKILASAGHEKKVGLWNMETLRIEYTPEEHSFIITDVCFRPNSSLLATSSFDRTIKLWNAADVTSLDFHPKKTDLLCSCDGNGEIRYWNVTEMTCLRAIKGGSAHVRFQPNTGQFLAAAAENVVSIFDIETHGKKYTLQGHNTDVQSVCWDNSGEYLASVSQDRVRVWSISSGDCIHELSANGNKFHCSVFHPSHTNLLVIGGNQSLEIWNMAKNQVMTVQAHRGLIATLAQSPATGMVASASHDYSVRLWK